MSSVAWNLKNIVLLINMSMACKKFYEIVETSEAACTHLVTSSHNEDLRKTCKNVLRFNRAAFRKLSAFGVFAVDAGLPTRVLAAVLAYTVVLLQFAFLSG
ncbi:hypothetical protein MSG28_013856 [Choristoneura fumiferana]|uniref:Uncharacterized protein n=2 Tax=Choristoneura fumiferana TaxID=7141 RepID=A0ACC0K9B7_CHOFU|nr:hypothetical protein MSG28_013855 [Choristoneura fumiferana]KAI8432969.1 hypothetical protein MSG28_013856 [Choristoneura fumiferana]